MTSPEITSNNSPKRQVPNEKSAKELRIHKEGLLRCFRFGNIDTVDGTNPKQSPGMSKKHL